MSGAFNLQGRLPVHAEWLHLTLALGTLLTIGLAIACVVYIYLEIWIIWAAITNEVVLRLVVSEPRTPILNITILCRDCLLYESYVTIMNRLEVLRDKLCGA